MGKKDDEDVTMRQRLEDEKEINRLRAIHQADELQRQKREAEKEAQRQRELQAKMDEIARNAKDKK